ncbi:esterase-like activity of phytase family protein [Lacihabitans sp. LS3-19]|uniref:esterase-like activity of phytase family protein n=1 Tax=Lacihabitans sp. LS3-19 TaxID=2487335 RepID=UPI0020CEF7B5|nr:esterase-like activity of phytase family protein [Lacihabitans sp. LS3-19]MCP9766406.1 esterase-like activity of phytase family protein [Lacihabitans sp. LS3-19]
MSKCLVLVLFLCSNFVKAQISPEFSLVKIDSIFTFPSDLMSAYPPEVKFGGISGLEYFEGSLYMVSDRAFKSTENQNSYLFKTENETDITGAFKFFGVDNAESIRIDKNSQKMYFAFEREDSTGIGYINENNVPNNLAVFSMTNDTLTSENRGIESLCFDENRNLWFAFESSLTGSIPFFTCPFNLENNAYDFNKKQVFQYPFDARICLTEKQNLNGNLGNGVTEILPYGTNSLLVMERCFDNAFVTMRLFKAEIPTVGDTISKEKIFEFTIQNEYLGKNHALKPDNMEGMTWGQNEDGQRVLYIISDDNFNPKKQRTLLLKLKNKK